jgi:hypothetical protein
MAQAVRAFRGDRFEDAMAGADAARLAMEAVGCTFAGQEISKDPLDGADQLVYHYAAPDAPASARSRAPVKQLPSTLVRTYHGTEKDCRAAVPARCGGPG